MPQQAGDGIQRETRTEGPTNARRLIPVILVARNNLHLTKPAIKSVEAQDHPVEILVVDNCSSDGTAQWLRTKRLMTITAPEQWSLAKCWNQALAGLWRAGWDKALVANNDIILRPDTVRLLAAHGSEFVTGVSVGSWDGIAEDPERLERLNGERPHPDFSCFLISRAVTDRVGWFDESYFPAYCEDSDFHVRMHRAGVRAVCVDVPFLHPRGSTLRSAGAGEVARIRRGADANRERFRQAYGCLPGSAEYQELFK